MSKCFTEGPINSSNIFDLFSTWEIKLNNNSMKLFSYALRKTKYLSTYTLAF